MTNNRHIGFLVASALLIVSVSVWTADEHHPAATDQPSAAVPTKTAPATANSTGTKKCFEQTHQQMKKIQAQMDKIHQTKDPKGRQRLMTEHMQAIQDMMQTVHSTGSPVMVDMMGGQGMGTGGTVPMMSGSGILIEQRMGMMEDHMGMMQVMMDRMLKQQEPSKKP